MAKGGKQPGAGRPKGSTNVPQFRDFITDKDIKNWLEILRDQVVQDNKLLMWALDHIYGKAPQALTGPDGKDLFPSAVDTMTNEQLETILKERSTS